MPSLQSPQVRGAFGAACQVFTSLMNERHAPRAFAIYGSGPKSRSRAAQEMFLQRMNQVFSLGKELPLQPPSRELERNAAHLQINNLHWLRRQ